jgi:hypothetical protein
MLCKGMDDGACTTLLAQYYNILVFAWAIGRGSGSTPTSLLDPPEDKLLAGLLTSTQRSLKKDGSPDRDDHLEDLEAAQAGNAVAAEAYQELPPAADSIAQERTGGGAGRETLAQTGRTKGDHHATAARTVAQAQDAPLAEGRQPAAVATGHGPVPGVTVYSPLCTTVHLLI